jgi:cytochrome b involved in lipid metabolism
MVPDPNKIVSFRKLNAVNSKAKERLEILYDGYYYDITDFVDKHPGGNVIKFYTEKGEDATAAIQQFHNRSRTKINLMLKSFKKRPCTETDCKLSWMYF